MYNKLGQHVFPKKWIREKIIINIPPVLDQLFKLCGFPKVLPYPHTMIPSN